MMGISHQFRFLASSNYISQVKSYIWLAQSQFVLLKFQVLLVPYVWSWKFDTHLQAWWYPCGFVVKHQLSLKCLSSPRSIKKRSPNSISLNRFPMVSLYFLGMTTIDNQKKMFTTQFGEPCWIKHVKTQFGLKTEVPPKILQMFIMLNCHVFVLYKEH